MPAESKHHISGPLAVAIGLAVSAGFVDAFIYRNVSPVFVANMSGNMIRVGMAIGDLDGHAIAMSAIALAAFLGAAMVGAMLIDVRLGSGELADPAPLLVAETALLAIVAAAAISNDVTFSSRLVGINVLVVVLGSAAMGLQAVALRRVGETAVSTTYGTGAVVRIGEKVALALRRAPRHHGVPRRNSVVVLTSILFAYVAGAAAAAAAPSHHGLFAAIPVATLLLAHATHVVDRRNRERRGPDQPHRRRVTKLPRHHAGL